MRPSSKSEAVIKPRLLKSKVLEPLTKAETVALWHAVDDYALNTSIMSSMDFPSEQIEAQHQRLKLAKKALRKVNLLRKAGL